MKVWIFNHYAQGADLPGGTRHFDLAKALVTKGHEVTIFAAGFHYTLLKETVEYDQREYTTEEREGVCFVWIKTFPYRRNDWRRLVNIASYAWKLGRIVPKLGLERPDVIIGSVVHPFAPLIAARFARRYKVPFVYEIRDLWPQTFIDMGVWSEHGLKSRFFKMLEARSVQASQMIIALSPMTADYIIREYGEQQVLYLPNGVDLTAFEARYKTYEHIEGNPTIERLRRLRSNGRFVVLFTGAVVQSNNISLFLECAKELHGETIHIVIVGKGMERERYESAIKDEGLQTIEFLDPVEKYLVPVMLRLADALMLVQGKVQWGSTNKLFDYMASGRPIVTALYAAHNDIVSDAHCGFAADPDSAEDVARKLEGLERMSKEQLRILGKNAIEYVRKNHAIDVMAERLETALEQLNHKEEK